MVYVCQSAEGTPARDDEFEACVDFLTERIPYNPTGTTCMTELLLLYHNAACRR